MRPYLKCNRQAIGTLAVIYTGLVGVGFEGTRSGITEIQSEGSQGVCRSTLF